MAFYAKVRKVDSLVTGLSILDPSQAVNWPPGADEDLVEITEAQYNTARSTGLVWEGSSFPRYKWVDPDFVGEPDPRPTVTFTPTTIDAEVGDIETVQIDHSGGLNGTIEFTLAGVPTRLDFVSGTATGVAVNTTKPRTYTVGPQQAFQVVAKLVVTIFARTIGPRD